jgi:centromere protein J
VIYWYNDPKIIHTTYKDGLELYEFENGQLEKHLSDGSREILFPDKTIKYIYADGREECFFPDGKRQKVLENGDRVLEFPNGIKEVYTREGVRRELSEFRDSFMSQKSHELKEENEDVEPLRESQQCEWIEL